MSLSRRVDHRGRGTGATGLEPSLYTASGFACERGVLLARGRGATTSQPPRTRRATISSSGSDPSSPGAWKTPGCPCTGFMAGSGGGGVIPGCAASSSTPASSGHPFKLYDVLAHVRKPWPTNPEWDVIWVITLPPPTWSPARCAASIRHAPDAGCRGFFTLRVGTEIPSGPTGSVGVPSPVDRWIVSPLAFSGVKDRGLSSPWISTATARKPSGSAASA